MGNIFLSGECFGEFCLFFREFHGKISRNTECYQGLFMERLIIIFRERLIISLHQDHSSKVEIL